MKLKDKVKLQEETIKRLGAVTEAALLTKRQLWDLANLAEEKVLPRFNMIERIRFISTNIRPASAFHEDVSQYEILLEVIKERKRQEKLWGEQNHSPLEWLPILAEEFGEVSTEIKEGHFATGYDETTKHYIQYRKEIIEVAAVAVAMAESFDRQLAKSLEV